MPYILDPFQSRRPHILDPFTLNKPSRNRNLSSDPSGYVQEAFYHVERFSLYVQAAFCTFTDFLSAYRGQPARTARS